MKSEVNHNWEKKQYRKELKALVIPIAIQNFMLALVSATDAAMLGFLDQDSMASVSQAGQVQFILNILVTSFSIGVGIMTAQYWGKGDVKSIEKIAPIGLKIILAIGAVFTLAAFFVPDFIMGILTNDPNLIPLGAHYLKAVALSYFLCGISQVYFALLKNSGHTDKSSAISSAAVVINIVLNAIFIFGLLGLPKMGIAGAALATVLTRAIELALAMYVNHKSGNIKLRWELVFQLSDKVLRGDFMTYTVPIIGAGLVWGVAYMSYSVIMGHMGGDAVAANSITSIVRNLISPVIRGVGGGAGILIGNLLGANQLDKAKNYAVRLTKSAAIVGVVTGGLLIAITPVISNYLRLTDLAAYYLQFMLVMCGFNLMAQSVNTTVLDGIFCAGGDSKFDMNTNIIFMWCFSLPAGLLAAFVFHLSVPLVYIIMNLDEIIKLPVVFHHYKKYIWLKNITRD